LDWPTQERGIKTVVSSLYAVLLVLAAAGFLFVFWWAAIFAWALVLRRMAESVSTWQELEEGPPFDH
jgi:cytoskeletal protein RodZ